MVRKLLMTHVARFVVAMGLLATVLVPAAFGWPQDQAKIGAERHPKILAELGGEISNAALAAYVTRVGQRIVSVTPYATEPWHFTVVDTPTVNAFATTGGYVYVTRGMLALANSEAELAAVIAHEIAHITANHLQSRQERENKAGIGVLVGTALGALLGGKEGIRDGIKLSSRLAQGYVAQFSQKQEFEADAIGTKYLAAAGYDPAGQARILANLAAKRTLDARISGKSYNPNRVDFFASHPATADRVRKAERLAEKLPQGEVAERPFMAAIDGMIYGDSAAQGFVRGQRFIHPEIGFEFSVPDNFTITNSARSVVAEGPNGAKFILDAGGPAKGGLEDYLRGTWMRLVKEQYKAGDLRAVQTYRLNGVDAATGLVDITLRGQSMTAQLTLVRLGDAFHRLSGLAPRGDWETLFALGEAARTYRAMSPEEAARARPHRIYTTELRAHDTLDRLAAAMPLGEHGDEIFLTLNGLAGRDLQPGDLVKLVVE